MTTQILLAKEEILEYIHNGHTKLEIALAMRTDINLVAMKMDIRIP